jgi:hypothetical protein
VKRDTYVAVLGNGSFDAILSPETREWLLRKGDIGGVHLNPQVQDRVLLGIERVRQCAERDEPVSGIIFTSGSWNEHFRCTTATAMERYTDVLFRELSHSGLCCPPVIVNCGVGVEGLIAEMRWAYREAKKRSERPRIEFVTSVYQEPLVHLTNWTFVRIPDYWVFPAGHPIFR